MALAHDTEEALRDSVYVVTMGSYSDYHIVAVFSTREKAESFATEYNGHKSHLPYANLIGPENIEEWKLDAMDTRPIGRWYVAIDRSGNIVQQSWELEGDPHEPAKYWPWREPVGGGIVAYGITPEHGRRAAEELRRILLTTPGREWYSQ